jgi:hypothetical protein
MTIRINGLRNKITAKNYGSAAYSHVLRVSSDTPVRQLGDYLVKELPGKALSQTWLTPN